MTSLFGYHRLRDKEAKKWGRKPPARALALQDPEGLEQLVRLIKKLDKAYSKKEIHNDFIKKVSPTAADTTVATLCNAYRSGTELIRSYVRSQIDEHKGWQLLTFSKRAAVNGINMEDPDHVRNSLIAHAIEDLAARDVRDNLIILGLVYHCAAAIHPDPASLFEEVAAVSGPAISQVLGDFIERDDLDDVLNPMGWTEVKTEDGIGFRWDF